MPSGPTGAVINASHPAATRAFLDGLGVDDRPGAATCVTFLPTFEGGLTIVDVLDRQLSGI